MKVYRATFFSFLLCQLDVCQMEEQTYHLRIHCKKGPRVLVQLTKALEALDFEIINANLTAVNDHILNTIVMKVTFYILLLFFNSRYIVSPANLL